MSEHSPKKADYGSAEALRAMIAAARGDHPVDLVLRGAHYLDVFTGAWAYGDVAVHRGVIVGTGEAYTATTEVDASGQWIVPGFIDAHVHIESSLLTPARFQQAVLPEGTTSVVWDPHEIANVWGVDGIQWALAQATDALLDIFVMIPSCVPSTSPEMRLETSGAVLHAADLAPLRGHPKVLGLAEMMNFPGLLSGDPDIMAKLTDFAHMRRDGHCPQLSGKDLNAYGVAGIHSCHESTTLPEAQEKLRKGIHVLIREGSCTKDADALLPLLTPYSSACVGLCSDDRNPADIAAEGHLNATLNKALQRGMDEIPVLRAASYGAARLYGLDDRGAVAPGYKADLVLIAPRQGTTWRQGLTVKATYKSGILVQAEALEHAATSRRATPKRRNLHLATVAPEMLRVNAKGGHGSTAAVRVIGVLERQVLTASEQAVLPVADGQVLSDLSQDVLKIAVFERHHGTGQRSVGFVRGFHLTSGAIATSINHDSHNVICVGSSDALMVKALNTLREIDGGIVVVSADGRCEQLPLEIAGLMTDRHPHTVATTLHRLKALTAAAGCRLDEPFLQLSFLALPVIPALKITDLGLVDGHNFSLVPVVIDG
ncbi:MAG: adenine deaminase [Proteobacteria bacterium]|nr:adenine deaminase [Pseudomonadota bacterium]